MSEYQVYGISAENRGEPIESVALYVDGVEVPGIHSVELMILQPPEGWPLGQPAGALRLMPERVIEMKIQLKPEVTVTWGPNREPWSPS